MNVLLTSAGRRSYLVDYFKQALNGNGMVIAANSFPDAPAMYAADKAMVVPPCCEKDYIEKIVSICRQHNVDLICSLHDLDVYVLSQHIDKLNKTGSFPVLPDSEWGRISLDKYECNCILQKNGFPVPWSSVSLDETLSALADGELHFPVFLKARIGFGSLGLSLCRSYEELKLSYGMIQRQIIGKGISRFFECPVDQQVLIQQYIEGTEYCVDVVNDFSGNYVCHLALQVHQMRAGETDLVSTVDPCIAGGFPERLSLLTKHPGIWGVDVIYQNKTPWIIDINPRFTGDYPFHHISGADIPAAMISWSQGKDPDPAWFKSRVGVKGYKDLVPRILA